MPPTSGESTTICSTQIPVMIVKVSANYGSTRSVIDNYVIIVIVAVVISCSKLINKSVPNTVDLRALTKIPTRGSADAKREALEENMVLVVESARAIGCQVNDTSGEKILEGDPTTIRKLLVDLIRVSLARMLMYLCVSVLPLG